MKTLKLLVLVNFLVILLSACNKVGALITNTGDYVSKTGEIISGKNNKKQGLRPPIKKKNKGFEETVVVKSKTRIKKRPQVASVIIKTTPTSNSSIGGKVNRIKITVVQLKSVGHFSNSRVSSLQNNLNSTLGADFISRDSVSILPNKQQTIKLVLDPSAKVIGVFGAFKQLNNTVWKTMVNIPSATNKKYSINVLVGSNNISAKNY